MQLEKIDINLRPRNKWEAIDLGHKLMQSYWRQVYPAWSILVISLAFICYACSLGNSYGAFTLFWFFVVYCERICLIILSQASFGEKLTTFQALKSCLKNTKGLIGCLTFYRFSPNRSLVMAVPLLENQTGKTGIKRSNTLVKGQTQQAYFSMIFSTLETFIMLTIMAIIQFLLPNGFIDFSSFLTEEDYYLSLINYIYVFYVIAVLLIRPFYVAGGFGIYLQRRTDLEGWDLQLAFQKIAKKIVTTTIILLFFLCNSTKLQAQSVQDLNKEATEINNSDEFSQTQTISKYFRFPERERKNAAIDSAFFGILGWIIFGIFVSITAAVIIYFVFLLIKAKQSTVSIESPITIDDAPNFQIMGINLKKEKFPKNIIKTSRKLWEQGEHRQALSLLYRNSIFQIITHKNIRFKTSDTEEDCNIKVLKCGDRKLTEYFSTLTDSWLLCAYAAKIINSDNFESLCSNWQTEFGKHNE